MHTLTELAADLDRALEELRREAARRGLAELNAPLAWLAEARSWLVYELDRIEDGAQRDPMPFRYIPAVYQH